MPLKLLLLLLLLRLRPTPGARRKFARQRFALPAPLQRSRETSGRRSLDAAARASANERAPANACARTVKQASQCRKYK
jgi:hypothetical protein